MLPCSEVPVFSHADTGPYNIMFDEKALNTTGPIDWERPGWYPEYWKYSNIMRPMVYEN